MTLLNLLRPYRWCFRDRILGGLVLACVGWLVANSGSAVSSERALLIRAKALLRFVELREVPDASGIMQPTIIVRGANLQLVSGLGATNGNPADRGSVESSEVRTNGLGNLIVGYNEPGPGSDRTGSHNIVVGFDQDYSSFGGLVVGRGSYIGAPYASVSGGRGRALGNYSSVSGGDGVAYGEYATVVGGLSAVSSGVGSTVIGGDNNEASGSQSVVVGGEGNFAGGLQSVVLGGNANRALGVQAAIGGGVAIEEEASFGFSACGSWQCP